MKLNTFRNMLVPVFVGTGVFLMALSLITIVVRSPYTHANRDTGFDPFYSRSVQMLVGAPIPFTGDGLAVPLSSDPVQQGKQLFVIEGCAACHGLDGRGGVVGPSIIGTKAAKLRSKTLAGPRGMPAYAPGALTDADLAAIEAYLAETSK